MQNHQLINQDSRKKAYYTPRGIVLAAWYIMGGIDLDPACSHAAWLYHGKRFERFYTEEDDGLSRPWYGKVWLNWPYDSGEEPCPTPHEKCKKKSCVNRGNEMGFDGPIHIDKRIPGNIDWVEKLMEGYRSDKIQQACCISYAAMNTEWMKPLKQHVQFFFDCRVNFVDGITLEEKKGVTKDAVFTFIQPKDMDELEARKKVQGVFDMLEISGTAKV